MPRIYKFFANKVILLFSFLVIMLFAFYLFPNDAASYTSPGEPAHKDLQIQVKKSAVVDIVKGWGETTGSIETALTNYIAHLIKLDFIFPIAYVVFLISAIALLTNEPKTPPGGRILFLTLLPIAAGVCDYIENLLHIRIFEGIKTIEDLAGISANSVRLSFGFTLAKYVLILLPLALAVGIWVYREFFKLEKQTKPRDKYINQFPVSLVDVLSKEEKKIKERREKASKEFEAAVIATGQLPPELTPAQKKYKDLLKTGDRDEIGLAFSGGGIRSAAFNFGILQALAKLRVLPWVDYLTSVSGGGFTASCIISLLSLGKKAPDRRKKLYHFNTQWDYFPLNPGVQAFDQDGVAHEGVPSGDVGPPLKKISQDPKTNTNTQLAYLRHMSSYLAPRQGWVTRDMLRIIGATLIRISYTVTLFLAVLLVFSGIHYGLTAALTPSIQGNYDISAIEETEGKDQDPEPPQQVVIQVDNQEVIFDVPFELGQDEEQPEQKAGGTKFSILYLILGNYAESPDLVAEDKNPPLPDSYSKALWGGFVISLIVGVFLTNYYKKDPTMKYKLMGWKLKDEELKLTKETYVAIVGLRTFAGISYLILLALTLALWLGRYPAILAADKEAMTFYWALVPLLSVFAILGGWFIWVHFTDFNWCLHGMDEQLRIDTLVICSIAGLFLWTMTLAVSWLRFESWMGDSSGLQVFWIWMPAVFTLGILLGLAVLRLIPLKDQVWVQKGILYEDSINPRQKWFFNKVLERDLDFIPFMANEEINYSVSVWANSKFRSIFWTLQGLGVYGLLAFLILGLLVLPHYFSVLKDTGSKTLIPLAISILSAGWASLISSVIGKDAKPDNLLVKILALPEKIRNIVLGILVIVMTLSLVFVMQTLLDNLTIWQSYLIALFALGFIGLSGRFFDYNYITPHYFFRDRIAEVFLKTNVSTVDGHVIPVRNDQDKRLEWITPEGCSAPYHIVQTALNLPGSWHLRYKDRKSEVFILSKYYCGSDLTGYVSTHNYRTGLTKYARAVALSGAAVSSALGYHTFFAQAFMTTLLNVRLGLWLVSPTQYQEKVLSKYKKPIQFERKVFWPSYLWDEARGRINARRRLINLTDGEHTGDNSGIFPLLQRRCKIIIVGDAGQDPSGSCTSLFQALRMAKTFLGVKNVELNILGEKPAIYDPEKKEVDAALHHFAVGKITYVDSNQTSWLVHFRPVITVDDPGTILNYWGNHKMDFPHPSTADQFFDEEQFEVQRTLGEWSLEHTLKILVNHYETQAKTEQEKTTPDQALLKSLADKIGFLEVLLSDKHELDFELLEDQPGILNEFLETLFEISNQGAAQPETK